MTSCSCSHAKHQLFHRPITAEDAFVQEGVNCFAALLVVVVRGIDLHFRNVLSCSKQPVDVLDGGKLFAGSVAGPIAGSGTMIKGRGAIMAPNITLLASTRRFAAPGSRRPGE